MYIYIYIVFFFHMIYCKIPYFWRSHRFVNSGVEISLWVQGFESFNDTLNSMFIAGVPRYEKLQKMPVDDEVFLGDDELNILDLQDVRDDYHAS